MKNMGMQKHPYNKPRNPHTFRKKEPSRINEWFITTKCTEIFHLSHLRLQGSELLGQAEDYVTPATKGALLHHPCLEDIEWISSQVKGMG